MIKEYKSVVKAERFDGSEEMMARYSINKIASPIAPSGFDYVINNSNGKYLDIRNWSFVFIGQYLVTDYNKKIVVMLPDFFKGLYPEAIND